MVWRRSVPSAYDTDITNAIQPWWSCQWDFEQPKKEEEMRSRWRKERHSTPLTKWCTRQQTLSGNTKSEQTNATCVSMEGGARENAFYASVECRKVISSFSAIQSYVIYLLARYPLGSSLGSSSYHWPVPIQNCTMCSRKNSRENMFTPLLTDMSSGSLLTLSIRSFCFLRDKSDLRGRTGLVKSSNIVWNKRRSWRDCQRTFILFRTPF